MLGYCRNIIPFSSVDGPGNRSVAFLQGCNFHCSYCHNPETQAKFDAQLHRDEVQALEPIQLVAQLTRYRDFVRGVTISGGECTAQLDFLVSVCQEVRRQGVEVFVDTNGHLPPDDFALLCQHVDMFMIDVKTSHAAEHLALTGQHNAWVLRNLRHAVARRQVYEVRTVVAVGLEHLERTVADVSEIISVDAQIRYKLIKFRRHGVADMNMELQEPDAGTMRRLRDCAAQHGAGKVIVV